MDSIFHKTKSVFSVVRLAKEEPRRFGKNGEVLINYDEAIDDTNALRRRSVTTGGAGGESKATHEHV